MQAQPVAQNTFPSFLPSTMWPVDSHIEDILNANSFHDMAPFGETLQDNLNFFSPGAGLNGSTGADILSNDSWLFKMTFNDGATLKNPLNVVLPDLLNSMSTSMFADTLQSPFKIKAEDLLERCRIPL